MADYDAVYKLLYAGIMAAIMEIEKKNYGNVHMAPHNARGSAVIVILEAGDMDNPVLKKLMRPEDLTAKN